METSNTRTNRKPVEDMSLQELEELIERKQEYYRQWREKNREHIRKYHNQWCKDRNERIRKALEMRRQEAMQKGGKQK